MRTFVLLPLLAALLAPLPAPAGAEGLSGLSGRIRGASVGPAVAAQPSPAHWGVPLDRAQVKVSHNSYERREAVAEQLAFSPDEPWQAGCRGVEFDCRQDRARVGEADDWRWSVQHDGEFSEAKPSLASFLRQVRLWSDRNPRHDPVFVHIELKDAFGDDAIFAKKLDSLILKELCGARADRLYRPADLMRRGGGRDLVAAATARGFPTVGELRGKFLVVLTGGDGGAVGRRRAQYADAHRDRALAFVDRAVAHAADAPSSFSGNRVFLNIEVQDKFWRDSIRHRGERDKWKAYVRKVAATRGLLVRGWKVNDAGLWRECLEEGVNLLATDKIRDHDWATVGAAPFRERAPNP